ncbi:hypothetical protein BGW80DRAFT_1380918 [Lactifluus volemus]|nr:hypothetical protein BGW80DRAFT_1380918 [Lactifluus volemus]
MHILPPDQSTDPFAAFGLLLIAILLNAFLFGVVSQQFYIYWTSGFKDPKFVKIFVVIQFALVNFQAVTLWVMAWNIFYTNYGRMLESQAYVWATVAQSLAQSVLVLSANMFLAYRIYSLTKSRLQTGLVIAFSTSAFLVGIIVAFNTLAVIEGIATMLILWDVFPTISQSAPSLNSIQMGIGILCYGLQTVAECLITIFLSRALLKSRTGLQKSDSVVNYLLRRVIQIGFLASLWTVAGLATWFLLPKVLVFMFFSSTVGPMYTNVIYDTLLSRVQLRQRLAEDSDVEIGFSPESHASAKSEIPGGQRGSSLMERTNDNVSFLTTPNQDLTTADAGLGGTVTKDDSEV